MAINAGGFYPFKPTDNSTRYVRAAIEGPINGFYDADVDKFKAVEGKTAGRFATITTDGKVALATKGAEAVGLIREDLVDMANASGKTSFYFGFGEYHVAEARLGKTIDQFTVGAGITCDADGQIVPAADGDVVLGVVTAIGEYRMGNMYEWAGDSEFANGGKFLGFILK